LPDSSDPSGSMMGAWRRNDVLETLARHGVTIAPVKAGSDQFRLSSDEDEIEQEHDLPPIVSGVVVRQLSRAFSIPIAEFLLSLRTGLH
jgi:hypothetical protein